MASKERQLNTEKDPDEGVLQLPLPVQTMAKLLCHTDGQAQQLAQALSNTFAKTLEILAEKKGYTFEQALVTLNALPDHVHATALPKDAHPHQPGTEEVAIPVPAGKEASQPNAGEVGGAPVAPLNEESMEALKRKDAPRDLSDSDEEKDREERAAAELLGDSLPDKLQQKEPKEKKVRIDEDKSPLFRPTMSQAIQDTEAIAAIIKKGGNATGGSAAAISKSR